MTDRMPKRIIAIVDYDGEADGKFCDADIPIPPAFDDGLTFLRADTAVTKAEADAMVAAAVGACVACLEEAVADWRSDELPANDKVAQRIEDEIPLVREVTPAHARAAFEQAVQEAVEAERARIVKIVAGYVGCDNIVDAIRAPQETSE